MAQKISTSKLSNELKVRGITLGVLSDNTGISKPHLSMMLSGKRNMSINKLNSILSFVGIDVNDIIEK